MSYINNVLPKFSALSKDLESALRDAHGTYADLMSAQYKSFPSEVPELKSMQVVKSFQTNSFGQYATLHYSEPAYKKLLGVLEGYRPHTCLFVQLTDLVNTVVDLFEKIDILKDQPKIYSVFEEMAKALISPYLDAQRTDPVKDTLVWARVDYSRKVPPALSALLRKAFYTASYNTREGSVFGFVSEAESKNIFGEKIKVGSTFSSKEILETVSTLCFDGFDLKTAYETAISLSV